MRKQTSLNNAILVLEYPWQLDSSDANRSSVLPFVEGVAKWAGNTEVFHANFYDYNSFKQALACLCKTKYSNTIVYIAGHGSSTRIGSVKIDKALFEIGIKSKEFNITGVLLGACLAGADTIRMEVYVEGTNLRWCAGYASAIDWLPGTLVDCAILAGMCEMDSEDATDRDRMIEMLGNAVAPFSEKYPIGTDGKDNDMSLRDSLRFVVQPVGKGRQAKTVSDAVFESHMECQMEA